MAEVCADASLILKLVLPEPDHLAVHSLWTGWQRDGIRVVAPSLWQFEVHAVLRRHVTRGLLSASEAWEYWLHLRSQDIHVVQPRGLFDRAWALAAQLSRPVTYDTVYAAVAELRGCELWTADRRLINASAGKLSWIRSV